MNEKVRKRAGGRAARVAERTAPKAPINPCPPGQQGGQYQPLTPAEISEVLDVAYRLLAEIGMADIPPQLAQQALSKGATLSDQGRLLFSREFVENIVAGAAKSFTFYGRDPKHDFVVGGDRTYYGTGGAAVQTKDLHTGKYRASTLTDVYDFTRLIDKLDNINWFTRCCIATEIPDVFDVELNTAYAMVRGTTKPLGMSFTEAHFVDPIIDLFDIASGGPGKFAERPFCKVHISPVISPMKYGEDAFDVALAAIKRGMPINSIIAAQSGATAPATLAGMLAQSTAETLAGLIMVNIFEPGFPVIFSNWPFVIDLRTGAFSGSGGEISLMNAAAAQIGNALNLPTGVASSMADAKAVDAQMGAEKALSAAATGLAGANMIYESAGMMASLLGASFEAFVTDNEMLATVQRLMRGIEVNEETLGFDAIKSAIFGEGHFLGGDHTLAAMQRDYYYPAVGDRDTPRVWEEGGSRTHEDRAKDTALEILAMDDPQYITAEQDTEIRKRFNILLD
jgi:trimethylamine--corrinoid protein Co-methyltransferase